MQMLAVSFTQHYTPVADNLALSALVAALPVIVLLGLLGLLRVRAHYAALAGLATALLVALLVYRDAGTDGDGGAGQRGAVRVVPDRLDRAHGDVRLRHHRQDRRVRGGKGLHRRHGVRPAHPGSADRVLLRRLPGGRSRVRHPGRDLRGHADRARLPAVARSRAVADRQHRPGRVRGHRHPGHHPGRGDRTAGRHPERDGRPPTAVLRS